MTLLVKKMTFIMKTNFLFCKKKTKLNRPNDAHDGEICWSSWGIGRRTHAPTGGRAEKDWWTTSSNASAVWTIFQSCILIQDNGYTHL